MEPVNNEKFLETKIKCYGNEFTSFYDKKPPKVDSNHTCLAAISFESAPKDDDSFLSARV